MVNKLMYISNDDTQNYFCILKLVVETLNTKLNKSTKSKFTNVLKVVDQRIRKRYYKTLWTCVIDSPFSPLTAGQRLVEMRIVSSALHLFLKDFFNCWRTINILFLN